MQEEDLMPPVKMTIRPPIGGWRGRNPAQLEPSAADFEEAFNSLSGRPNKNNESG
jgi:hypothetical protein